MPLLSDVVISLRSIAVSTPNGQFLDYDPLASSEPYNLSERTEADTTTGDSPCLYTIIQLSQTATDRIQWQRKYSNGDIRTLLHVKTQIKKSKDDVNKRSNLMQQYADIYSLQSHSTCFGRHSAHHQKY